MFFFSGSRSEREKAREGIIHRVLRCVQLAGYFSTKFLRFPRLAAQICYIYNVNTREANVKSLEVPTFRWLKLLSWRPSKEVPKPLAGKVQKRVLLKVPAENEVLRRVLKKCFWSKIDKGTKSTCFGTFLGTAFGGRQFPKHSSALSCLAGLGHFFGWSLESEA